MAEKETKFEVQPLCAIGEPALFEVVVNGKTGTIHIAGDDTAIVELGEVAILPYVIPFARNLMYTDLVQFPESKPQDRLNVFFVCLRTGNLFSCIIKTATLGFFIAAATNAQLKGQSFTDAIKTTSFVINVFLHTYKNGRKGYAARFEPKGEIPKEKQGAIAAYLDDENTVKVSWRNLREYERATGENALSLLEKIKLLPKKYQKQIN